MLSQNDPELPTTTKTTSNLELIAAVVLGLLALACFILQIVTLRESSTKLETALFNILQFVLTVGFTWFSSRTISKSEFEANLKKFAISAYRRISDIENIVQRLQTKISGMRGERENHDTHDLDVILAIVDDTAQIVTSSIADWGDVIGEELITLEKIKRLEKEKEEIRVILPSEIEQDNAEIQRLDKKIDSLLSMLPARLQLETRREDATVRTVSSAIKILTERHKKDGKSEFLVRSGGEYGQQINPNDFKLKGTKLSTSPTDEGRINVVDDEGIVWGRVLKPREIPLRLFHAGLEAFYGTVIIPIEFVDFATHRDPDLNEKFTHYKIRVLAEPALDLD